MGYTLACRDAGEICDFVAKGETEEEVLAEGVKHVKEVHGYTDERLNDPKFLEEAKKIIKITTGISEEQIYKQAKKRVEAKKGFYIHLTVYILVNILLVLIWAFAAGGGFPWFIYPLGGWGIGILFNFLGVFVFEGKSDKAAIEKEAEKIRGEQR